MSVLFRSSQADLHQPVAPVPVEQGGLGQVTVRGNAGGLTGGLRLAERPGRQRPGLIETIFADGLRFSLDTIGGSGLLGL